MDSTTPTEIALSAFSDLYFIIGRIFELIFENLDKYIKDM